MTNPIMDYERNKAMGLLTDENDPYSIRPFVPSLKPDESRLVLRVRDKGWIWEVPALAIAANRATYYSMRDSSTTFAKEIKYGMSSTHELTEWFLNNMDWVDIADQAKLVERPKDPTGPTSFSNIQIVNKLKG